MSKPKLLITLSGVQEDTLRGYLGALVADAETPLADIYVLGSILRLLDPNLGFDCEHERKGCPEHEGAWDCTPFCSTCEGTQEYCPTCENEVECDHNSTVIHNSQGETTCLVCGATNE